MRIGIEIDDREFANVDLSDVDLGNPGIGGAQYILLLLSVNLCKYRDVVVFHSNRNVSYPSMLKERILSDSKEEILEENISIYIINNFAREESYFQFFDDNNIKVIIRLANFPQTEKLLQYRKHNSIRRYIFLGGEEYDRYLDDDMIERGAIIGNMHVQPQRYEMRGSVSENIVVYMGALVPQKGFHLLAKQWKHILTDVPDAKLYVLGSGRLYNKDKTLGRYGVASEDYEDIFMKYLVDENGQVLSSVVFFGDVGKEKNAILAKGKVGIPNPSGLTETFCNCAIEMQMVGLPVVTVAGFSFFDVVDAGKTGFLYRSEKEFRNRIVQLLKDNNLNKKMGEAAVKWASQFNVDSIMPKWMEQIEQVENNAVAQYLGAHGHLMYDWKWLNLINRVLRIRLGMRFLPSRMCKKFYFNNGRNNS